MARGSAAGGMSATVVFGQSSNAARKHNSLVISDQMLVLRSLLPSHSGFPSVTQLRCRIPRSFSHLWNVSKHRFAELQQLSAIRTTHDSLGWGLYIVSSEPRDEPSCMSNNPFHQCTVSGRSVLCSFLKRCQHRAHLSLQLFLIVFDSIVALMRSSWRISMTVRS